MWRCVFRGRSVALAILELQDKAFHVLPSSSLFSQKRLELSKLPCKRRLFAGYFSHMPEPSLGAPPPEARGNHHCALFLPVVRP